MNRPSPTTKALPTAHDFRLHWPQKTRIGLRPPLPSEASLLQGPLLHAMTPLQVELSSPMEERLLLLDEQIIGRCAMSEAPLHQLPAQLWRAELKARGDQKWALAGQLCLDRRLLSREDSELTPQILSLAGPQTAALYARRFNLPGFLASLWLPGYKRWTPQLSPQAYAQQVWAGSLNEPVLEAYLNFGARILGVKQDAATPQVLIAWADPYR